MMLKTNTLRMSAFAILFGLAACGEPDTTPVVVPEPVVGEMPVAVAEPEDVVMPEPVVRVPAYDVTPQNRSALYKEAIAEFKAGDMASAHPKFEAIAESGFDIANVYLGIIEGREGAFNNPRSSLSRHYQVLESRGHTTSLRALAMGLERGTVIEADPVGAAQYYLRLLQFAEPGSSLAIQAGERINRLSPEIIMGVSEREGAVTGMSARTRSLQDIVSATIEAQGGSWKAPGTDYLAGPE